MKQFQQYFITVDKDLNLMECSDDFLHYLGLKSLLALDQIIPPQDMMQLRNALFAINPGSIVLTCFRIRTVNGTLNWIAANLKKPEEHYAPIRMEFSDIQSLKEDIDNASYDKMTGLLNKQAIIDYAQELTYEFPRKTFYLFLMDIDHFKLVNDAFGHKRGDEIIAEIAQIVENCVGGNGQVGRIGGDEFMLVLENISTEIEAREILRDIRDSVREKYENCGEDFGITVSLGGVLFPEYVEDYDSLFMVADKMLYIAKVKGRDRYVIYTPSVHGEITNDSKFMAVSHYAAREDAKTGLMIELMDNFLMKDGIPVQTALERLAAAYDLDGAYIVDEESQKSRFGVNRQKKGGEDFLSEAEIELPILRSAELQSLFDANGMAIANVFDLNKAQYSELKHFMDENRFRVLVACRLNDSPSGGYIVYLNRADSACRLSETDLSDLIYFAHMAAVRGV